jgi:hypothetical protein
VANAVEFDRPVRLVTVRLAAALNELQFGGGASRTEYDRALDVRILRDPGVWASDRGGAAASTPGGRLAEAATNWKGEEPTER